MPNLNLPPFDILAIDDGFALLIHLGPTTDLEVSLSSQALFVAGVHHPVRPISYAGILHKGQPEGLFEYEFSLPLGRQSRIRSAKMLLDGVLQVCIVSVN
jgi:HSP20 family molecular chaperone IbpA